jgi:hypothetical protein
MYCPKCGVQNIEEAKFCRMCGASFQMLSSTLSPYTAPPNYERAIRKLFMGIGLLLIALVSTFSHRGFFWWMIFPAIPMVSKGIEALIQNKHAHNLAAAPRQTTLQSQNSSKQADYASIRARQTGELVPPSVTENTTKLFDSK